jgi:hypothetical protein
VKISRHDGPHLSALARVCPLIPFSLNFVEVALQMYLHQPRKAKACSVANTVKFGGIDYPEKEEKIKILVTNGYFARSCNKHQQ